MYLLSGLPFYTMEPYEVCYHRYLGDIMTAEVARNPVHLYSQAANDYAAKSARYAEQVAKTVLPPPRNDVPIPCVQSPSCMSGMIASHVDLDCMHFH